MADDIQILPDSANSSLDTGRSSNLIGESHVASILARVGLVLKETYSEESQETGDGFITALSDLQSLSSALRLGTVSESIAQASVKDGLLSLCTYLEGKIKKRLAAMGSDEYAK
jgi:hypothetical protein